MLFRSNDVTLKVVPGTVHALLGENGAGKSTLVKCLAGVHRPDAGSILCDGREQDIANPIEARALGIGMVYQHFTLANGMTVAENLLLAGGQVPAWIDWRAQRQRLQAFLETTPFQLDLEAKPGALSAGEKQKLELLKQLYLRPRLLILDEPTSVLSPQAIERLFGTLRTISAEGCSVLYISHKLDEIRALCRRATVLRGGKECFHTNLALAARGLAALKRAGIDAEVKELMIAMRGRMLHEPGGTQRFLVYGQRATEEIYSVSRSALNALLYRIATERHHVPYRFGETCVGIDLADGMPIIQSADGSTRKLEADVVFATDGAGSQVRRALADAGEISATEDLLDHGYKELTIAANQDGGFSYEPHALHIWPRGRFMLIALPNPKIGRAHV